MFVQQAVAAVDAMRPWRNKKVAHNDLDHLLGRTAQPLNDGSRQQTEDALQAVRNVFHLIEPR